MPPLLSLSTKVKTMANSEKITLVIAEQLPLLGSFKSNWRRRDVTIHDHPERTEDVVSIGRPFDGSEAIVCVEHRSAYHNEIGRFGTVYQ